MEDVVEDYLNELVNRNMIQVTSFLLNGKVIELRVHDLVRDLAIQKATEHQLLGIFDSGKEHSSLVLLLQGQPRHAINNGIGEYLKLLGPSSSNDLKLRSLALVDGSGRLELEELKLIYTRFNYLKVLDLNGVVSKGIPDEIWNLVLLKFLGLSEVPSSSPLVISPTIWFVIPPAICQLKRLQTLYGSGNCTYGIPIEIYDLREFRHLNINSFYLLGDSNFKIGNHRSKLQTLRRILHYMPTLEPISSCNRLKSVQLVGKIKDPLELCFLPRSVTYLNLVFSGFREDPMPALGSLSNLTGLYLFDVNPGKKMVCSHDSFPSLQFLKLEALFFVEELQVEDDSMPCLKALTIDSCMDMKLIKLSPRIKELPRIPQIFDNALSLKKTPLNFM